MIRFSVIVAVYLGNYQDAATERLEKFKRCLYTLRNQEFLSYEVIIVSHGCQESIDYIEKEKPEYLAENSNFKLVKIPRLCLHEGHTRQAGMEAAQGQYIVFVDSDDIAGLDYLEKLDKELRMAQDPDFAYYNVQLFGGVQNMQTAIIKTKLSKDNIGNGMIAFKRELLAKGLTYDGLDGYGHDWLFINRILEKTRNYRNLKTNIPYFVCHIPYHKHDV